MQKLLVTADVLKEKKTVSNLVEDLFLDVVTFGKCYINKVV